jgi:hypothetical protein
MIQFRSLVFFQSVLVVCLGSFLPQAQAHTPQVNVPQRVQVGPTCGLYALGMVMDYWHTQDAHNPTALVSQADLNGPGIQYNFEPTTQEGILPFAQRVGYTVHGEMFSAKFLAQTATHFGYQAAYYPHATLNDLYRVLDQHHPAIVGFDVNASGNPALAQGLKAHYAVIESYFDDRGNRYVMARHGWGTQTDYVWKASDLLASMKNLKYTDLYISEAPPSALNLPDSDGHAGYKDISDSLGDKIIEIVPQNENPVGGVLVH